jgi:hypothetical protein
MHLSDEDLVLAADGELSADRKAEVSAHLERCWPCRERLLSLQTASAEFARARNRQLDAKVPPAAGPRAQLRARLAELAREPAPSLLPFWRQAGFPFWRQAAAFVAVLGFVIAFQTSVSAEGPKPKARLTPGETRPITTAEVCRSSNADVISHDIPADMQQRVFAAYGIKSPRPDQFEVDYLITPDLGGTNSIRNLWPQPYSVRWNAQVKDKLEQRLHQLVCSGKLDLAIAQHDIAVDWIGAYRKYVSPQ